MASSGPSKPCPLCWPIMLQCNDFESVELKSLGRGGLCLDRPLPSQNERDHGREAHIADRCEWT